MSATTHTVYAGSYAATDQPGVYSFNYDAETGALEQKSAFAGIWNPSFIALHPNGGLLLAVGETDGSQEGEPGSVWSLRIKEDGFETINWQPSGGGWPCHLAFSPDGRHVAVSNYGSGTVGILPIMEDGSLRELTSLVQHEGTPGPQSDRQDGPHAHSALFSPDGRHLIVADLGLDTLFVYDFDDENGTLTEVSRAAATPGAGPRHTAFHPDGLLVYVANELENSVTTYAYDAENGQLTAGETLPTLPPYDLENTVADIHLAPDATRLYVSNRGHNSIATFAVDRDGKLEAGAIEPCGGDWPRNFAVAPDGRFLLVANQKSGTIATLPANEAGVDPAGGSVSIQGASCVVFAP